MSMLNPGFIIAIIVTMFITEFFAWLKTHIIKNPKIKHNIPSGGFIALVVGGILIYFLNHYGMFEDPKKTLWDFLGAWVVIIGLSGYGKIFGYRLMFFIKALLSDKQTQVAQAELEIQQLQAKVAAKKDKLNFLASKINGNNNSTGISGV